MRLDWTQEELAAKLQLAGLNYMDRGLVAKIESNIRSIYDYELVILSEVFMIPISELTPAPKNVKAELPKLIP